MRGSEAAQAFLAVLLLAPAAPATAGTGGSVGGGATPPPVPPQPRRVQEDHGGSVTTPQREITPSFQISGHVREAAGQPVAGLPVKLFSNGMLTTSTLTDEDGSFSIEGNPPTGGSDTVVLWFESPDPEKWLDVGAVLSQGRVARERELFPPCSPKVNFAGNAAIVEVRMMSPEERKADLEESKCLESGSAL